MTWSLVSVAQDRLPGLGIPDPGCAIKAGGDYIPGIGREHSSIYDVGMTLEALQLFASRNLPKSRRAVST